MRWSLQPVDSRRAAVLARELEVSPALARVLLRRGVGDSSAARRFLEPAPADLHEPSAMADMEKAVERLGRALRDRERVVLFGDYDVDGVTSLAILGEVFAAAGLPVIAHQPHRLREGYGLNPAAIRLARSAGATLLVALDCGTEAGGLIAAAAAGGLDVIVADHHRLRGAPPPAAAFLNPKREDCLYPFKDLASAGVTFKLVQAGWKRWGLKLDWERLWQLAALGTVADVAPLRGENRVLVSVGLKGFRNGKDPVFREICRVAGLPPPGLTARRLAFGIAPRLNAVGRLGEAEVGRKLLMSRDPGEIAALARTADRLNTSRRALEKAIFVQAVSMIEEDPEKHLRRVLVVAGEGWSRGVVGIAASRLVERYRRPAVVISIEGEEGTGSGRSVPGFNLFAALNECSDCLSGFGGHRQAAGLSLSPGRLDELREALDREAERQLGPEGAIPALELDDELDLGELDLNLAGELEKLEPCGRGNSSPIFFTAGLEVGKEARILGRGRRHLKIRLGKHGIVRDFLGWDMAGRLPELAGGRIDAAYEVRKGSWRGADQLELILKDFRPAESVEKP